MCMKHTTRSGNTLIRCSHANNIVNGIKHTY